MIKFRNNDDVTVRKKSKSRTKRIIAWLHLYPSLVSAVIVIFVCLTGTIIVYGDEIIDLFNRDAMYVPEVKEERLPLEQLRETVIKSFPKRFPPSYAVVYKDPQRSVKFNQYGIEDGLRFVFVDPYTGEIIKDDGTIYFFFITAHLHNSLMLGKTGQWIIDIASIIFLIGLITGIALWWPARWNKANINKSFKIKFKASFKRLNYDLHNVLGFYSLSIAFVLTVTGLLIAFPPLAGATISLFGGDPEPDIAQYVPSYPEEQEFAPMNPAIESTFKDNPDASTMQILFPRDDKAGYFGLITSSKVGLKSHDGGNIAFINRYTSQKLYVPRSVILHEKIENLYWMFHMGTWLGWFGKLVTFIGGLISTSLPITGFIIWWGRRKKRSKNRKTETAQGNLQLLSKEELINELN